jgi:tetratricopeptide (TPR) repeat protein
MLDRPLISRAFRAVLLAVAAAVLSGCGAPSLEDVRRLQDEDGNFSASVEPLQQLLEKNPDDREVNYRYGIALAATGQPELAKWSLRKAMESEEWFERSADALARALLETGDYDESAQVCGRLLERKPDDVPTLLVRADAYIRSRRNYEGALADAGRVLEIEPDNVDALIPRVVALLALERVDEAGEALEQLEGLYRDDSLKMHGSPGFCAARATFAKEKGENDAAAERYDACLELFPEFAPLVQDAVEFFAALGRDEHAQEILERAVEASPTDGNLRLALAMRFHSQGETERAKEVMRAGTRDLESRTDIAGGWAALGSFLLELGDYQEAADAFTRARELDPTGNPDVLFASADAAVVAGRYDEALRLAEQMSVPAHRQLVQGRVALSRREPRKALDHFAEGIRLWPDNAFARYYAAVAAEQLGDFDRAIEEYRYAMRIDPQATDAYLRLARLHAAAGRDSYAITALTFVPGGRPREYEAWLLEMRILARIGQPPKSPEQPAEGVAREHWSAGVAAVARGISDRDGPAAAVDYLRRAKPVDFADPAHADISEVWIESLAASGRAGEAAAKIEAALAGHSDVAVLHALRGEALQLAGGDPERARAAYDKALELDSAEPRALRGRADLAAAQGANDEALALYDRALAADPDSIAAARSAAKVLSAAGREGEAEERLATLLREHPYDAETALALAELYAARDASPAETRALARRAVLFKGGPKAKAFLQKLRGDEPPAPAAEAARAN